MTKRTKGLFIVLEGLDGAGTTTQARRLHNLFLDKGLSCELTNEPTDEPVGKLIRDALSGRMTSPATGERIEFSEAALSLLFAADRIEHSRAIERALKGGRHVVCDRYVWSSIAYQSLDPGIPAERVVEVNEGCSVPDVTILLEVPVKECLRRLSARKDSPTIYEKKNVLEGIRANYEATRDLYEAEFGPLVTIDGALTIERVHKEIVTGLRRFVHL